jgi:hypothetical protein
VVFKQNRPVGQREHIAMRLGGVLAIIADEQLNFSAEFTRVSDQ